MDPKGLTLDNVCCVAPALGYLFHLGVYVVLDQESTFKLLPSDPCVSSALGTVRIQMLSWSCMVATSGVCVTLLNVETKTQCVLPLGLFCTSSRFSSAFPEHNARGCCLWLFYISLLYKNSCLSNR